MIRYILAFFFLMTSTAASAPEWESLGNHPGAGALTGFSQQIRSLVTGAGGIYPAFGDETGSGDGPLDIEPWVPSANFPTRTGAFVNQGTQQSESFDTIVVLNGVIYIPNADYHHASGPPTDQESDQSYDYYDTATETWVTATTTNEFAHAYSMAYLGSDLYISGGYDQPLSVPGTDATISKKTGDTWARIKSKPDLGVETYARYYAMGTLGGNLYAQARDLIGGPPGPLHNELDIYDGSTWTSTLTKLNVIDDFGQAMLEFDSHLIYVGGGTDIRMFDGTTDSALASAAIDYTIGTDGILYVLKTPSLQVQWIDDLDTGSLTALTTGPANSRSIGYYDYYLFIGTTTAGFWRYPMEVTVRGGTVGGGGSMQ